MQEGRELEKPLLTIITATYNLVSAGRVERFRQCVESVRAQKCRQTIEHVIADGDSHDGTEAILREYAEKGYVRVVSKRDRSVYEGMNNGLAAARGKYVLFVNSDDFLCNDAELGKALDELEASGADYSFGDVDVLNADDSFCAVWVGRADCLPFAENYCHQSMIIKTDVIRGYGGFDLRYRVSADSDIMLRLYRDGKKFIHSAHKFACYRLGGLSSATDTSGAQADHAQAFFTYFGQDAGLTLEQCKGIWRFTTRKNGSLEECLDILVKMPKQEWRSVWLQIIRPMFAAVSESVMPEPVVPVPKLPWSKRLANKWRSGGLFAVVKAVVKKMRRADHG